MNLPHAILCLLATFSLCPPGRAADPLSEAFFRDLQQGKKQTVVVYGTSLTATGEWVEAMQEWFARKYPGQVTLINSGGPGQNSDWGVRQLKPKVLGHRPDLVFIEFSYNDAHQKFDMPLRRSAENLEAMIKAIQQQDPSTAIVLQIMNIPWDAPGGKNPLSNRLKLEEFNDNYRAAAATHRLPLIDHYATWERLQATDPEKFGEWLPDGSHPTAEASRTVTWPPIRDLLEKAEAAAPNSAQ